MNQEKLMLDLRLNLRPQTAQRLKKVLELHADQEAFAQHGGKKRSKIASARSYAARAPANSLRAQGSAV